MQGALSPGSQIPGPARCSEPTLGASVQYLLCTDPEKLSPSPLAFMASDLRCRSWGPPGRPTWSKDFALAFYPPRTPPSTLPVCSQLCEAGTDVQIAPLPLPRGRWPVCPVPRLCSPGKQGGYLKPQRPFPPLHPRHSGGSVATLHLCALLSALLGTLILPLKPGDVESSQNHRGACFHM